MIFAFLTCLHLLFLICSNVLIQGMTILAPVDSPNTDGINPGLFATFESLALLAIPSLER